MGYGCGNWCSVRVLLRPLGPSLGRGGYWTNNDPFRGGRDPGPKKWTFYDPHLVTETSGRFEVLKLKT